jgi:hypothetical protein
MSDVGVSSSSVFGSMDSEARPIATEWTLSSVIGLGLKSVASRSSFPVVEIAKNLVQS